MNIRDTIQCVDLAVRSSAPEGECRIFNQLTEIFSINELAKTVKRAGKELNSNVEIQHIANPRVESEDHYNNPKLSKMTGLGLEPNLLSGVLIEKMLATIESNRNRVNPAVLRPTIGWRGEIQ